MLNSFANTVLKQGRTQFNRVLPAANQTTMTPLFMANLAPQRLYLMQYLPKYRDIAKPTYFDNVNRRWDSRLRKSGW